MALTEVLSRCYVHLGAGGVAAILDTAEKMRSVGKGGLLVGSSSCAPINIVPHYPPPGDRWG